MAEATLSNIPWVLVGEQTLRPEAARALPVTRATKQVLVTGSIRGTPCFGHAIRLANPVAGKRK
jgi:hypothetical protein